MTLPFGDSDSDLRLPDDIDDSNNFCVPPKAKPFIKWAGGKTQLIDQLRQRFPAKFARYYEPFIGGGALFFDCARPDSCISDINAELIDCYKVVRDQTSDLIDELKSFKNEEDFFYQIRNADRSEEFKSWTLVRRAARFIFLNRTCFNGLHRVNSKGHFNVPFGHYKNPLIVAADNLMACSKALAQVEIMCAPFDAVESRAQSGDFIYFDPPYAPLSKTSKFTAYAKDAFGDAQQIELRNLCRRLDEKGVLWMLSNSSAELIADLYKEFKIETVAARRNINSVGSGRGQVSEYIIRNYD